MSILDFLIAVNGIAQLWGADGQFLGVLSSNQYDLNSVSNPNGLYGSSIGAHSIRNSVGVYGGLCGMYSAYNIHCYNPPIVVYQGQPVLVVTKNPYTQTNGLSVIDPDLLLGIYVELATSVPTNLVQVQLESLTHARQTAAEAINQAMIATAQMFH